MTKIITKKGFILKPDNITTTGVVSFTDGVESGLLADQKTCEAYGYRYNVATGTCSAFTSNNRIASNFINERNYNLGTGNRREMATQNNFIVGTKNTNKGSNHNTLILGEQHEIESGFSNASILGGSRAIVTRKSEVVSAGGGQRAIADSTDAATFNSRRQTSTIELSGVTIDNTATNLTVQGDGSSYINVKNNSIIGYDIYITRLELGGSSGTVGNYSYRNIRGAIQIDNSYTMAFVVGFSRNIAKIGQNGTCIMADTSTSDLKSISVNVQDRNNVHNLWSASVTLHEVISETTF
jgi:hypothetical protein